MQTELAPLLEELQQRVNRPEATADELRQVLQEAEPLRWNLRSKTRARMKRASLLYAQLLEALCAHPNASPDTLIDCLDNRENNILDGLLRNPVLPLLLLERPDFVQTICRRYFWMSEVLIQRPELPLTFLRLIPEPFDASTAFELRTHIALCPRDAPAPDSAQLEEDLRWMATRLRESQRQLLAELGEWQLAPAWTVEDAPENDARSYDDWEAVPEEWIVTSVRSGRHALKTLDKLRRNQRPFPLSLLWYRLAAHSETHPDVLRMMAQREYPRVRRAVRRHPNADDSIRDLCRATAVNCACSSSTDEPAYRFYRSLLSYFYTMPRITVLPGPKGTVSPSLSPFFDRLILAEYLAEKGKQITLGETRRLNRLKKDANRYVRATARGELCPIAPQRIVSDDVFPEQSGDIQMPF